MHFYVIDDIEQGTPDWLEWRRGVIGASEAAIIMGDRRHKGRQQLMNEKRGLSEPFSGNETTREGSRNEEPARKALQRKFKEKLAPTIVQDAHEPYLAASLDAINSDNNRIFEIKCGQRAYEYVSERRKVPSYYVAQLQHMLMVTQMESLTFAAFRPGLPLLTLNVNRSETFINELRKKEMAFIQELSKHGHPIQSEFRGKIVREKYVKSKHEMNSKTHLSDIGWRIEQGELIFWDGKNFLVGEEPGLYDLLGENHRWDGDNWIPRKRYTYSVGGTSYRWNGTYFEQQ